MSTSVKVVSSVFFLATVLLFQTVTFSPIVAQDYNEDNQIPSWFKNNAKWWKDGKISDQEIINAIENLLSQKIIKLDSSQIKSTTKLESSSPLSPNKDNAKIPSYVKNIFVFWEEGSVSDSDVANAIKFLIKENIIITSTSSLDEQPRQLAAIIDQLSDIIPNKAYQQKAQEYLEHAGFDVDVYTTKDVTLDFYKKLPSMNYKYIIFRTHSFEIAEYGNQTYLFTGEKYDVNKYILEQLSGQVARGIPVNEQELMDLRESDELATDKMYFVVGSKMMDELMVGQFPQSVIVIGGCESVRNHDLAKSLISRGASAVIGWDRTVGSMENDRVMLAFLEEILINKINIHDAIVTVMEEFGPDLKYSSELHYLHT